MSTNAQPVFDIGTISKTGCTFVDRGSSFSLSGNVTRGGLLWCSVPILPVYIAYLIMPFVKIYLQVVEPFRYMSGHLTAYALICFDNIK